MASEQIKEPLDGPLEVTFDFYMPRIKGHFKANGKLKASAPLYHQTKPDTTKLIRSTEDALKGIAWRDDSQVSKQIATKRYGDTAGAQITISALDGWNEL